MSPLIWALLALILGLVLVMLEFFVPSAGILGFLACTSLLVSLVLAFNADVYYGMGFLGFMIVALPMAIAMGLRLFPYTPVGRRVLLPPPGESPDDSDDLEPDLTDMIGRVGKAYTMMRPSGAIELDGRTIDAVSRGMPIERGQWVRVVEAHSNRVVVVPVEEHEIKAQGEGRRSKDRSPLDEPIESLGGDPFENPFS